MGTKSLWADVNTKPVQRGLFRIFRHQMMGVPIEYDNNVERRRNHPLLLPEVEAEGVSQADNDLLEKVQVIAPAKNMPSYKSLLEKGIIRGKGRKSISPRSKASEKQRSVLGEPKYGPGSEPQWKAGRTRYPAFYKALLEELPRKKRKEMLVADQQSSSPAPGTPIRASNPRPLSLRASNLRPRGL